MRDEHNHILLVEDNPDDETLTLDALQSSGVDARVSVARDGAEAIRMLVGDQSQQTPTPRLVLLDLKLSKVSGLEVLEAMRRNNRTRHVPVVVITSSTEERDIRRSYEAGANSYVRKPVDFEEFSRTVRLLGNYWLLCNEVSSPA